MSLRTLAIGVGLDLPLDFATQTSALVGKRGVGKTHCAVVFAEELLDAGLPVVILDPIGVWWGLRSSADGKRGGHSILVFGGEHGDLPLEASHGALLAQWVVAKRASIVIDMGEFSKGDQVRFVAEFLEQLYRKNREPLHVIIDEADAFAPQRLHPGAQRCFGAVDQVVRRGRARGLGVTLVTQRSAAINKDVLSQVEVLIAFRTLAPQDRAALEAWIDVHADRDEAKRVLASLASLKIGEAWVWSPAWLGILARVQVRRRRTFDSSATPKVGDVRVAPKAVAKVDVDELRGELAALVEKAEAEDPRRLRARIGKLEAELAIAKSVKPAIDRSEQVRELLARVSVLEKRNENAARLVGRAAALETTIATAAREAGELRDAVAAATQGDAETSTTPVARQRGIGRVLAEQVLPGPAASVNVPRGLHEAAQAQGLLVGLDRAQRAILTVLAQHPEGCDRNRLTLLAGYRWSGGFRNALGALRTNRLIVGGNSGVMRIEGAGLAALGSFDPLPEGDALRTYWLTHPSLGRCEREVLRVLLDAGDRGLDREALLAKTAYSWSGGFRNALGALRTAGLITGRNGDVLRASAHLIGG